MNYALFKLRFTAPLRAGEKNLSDGGFSLSADTIFSALCHEALASDGKKGVEYLAGLARSGNLLLSDALPYLENDLYVPKPVIAFKSPETSPVEREENNTKKAFKKLKYVPLSLLGDFMSGDFDAVTEAGIQSRLGYSDIRTRVAVGVTPRPYQVGSFKFAENAGLYIIVSHESGDSFSFVSSLLTSLAYSGIGGKRSSGFGRFVLEPGDASVFERRLKNQNAKLYMTMSVSMARPDELDDALKGAAYTLKKRAGFVSSPGYAENFVKKRDFYSFSPGSCFENRFDGDVFDVSNGGSHPVYRYAKPMFMGVA